MLLCSMRASWRYCYQTHLLKGLGRVPFVYLLRAQYDVWAKHFDFCFRWSLHFSDNNYPDFAFCFGCLHDWQRHLILPKTCDKLGWMSQWFGRPLHILLQQCDNWVLLFPTAVPAGFQSLGLRVVPHVPSPKPEQNTETLDSKSTTRLTGFNFKDQVSKN